MKKKVNISLIIVCMFIIFCSSISLAESYTEFGPGAEKKDLYFNEVIPPKIAEKPSYVEANKIMVTENGVYELSNSEDTGYIICEKTQSKEGENIKLLPLEVVVPAKEGENPKDEYLKGNNQDRRSTTVYMEKGKEYYIYFLKEGKNNITNNTIPFNVKRIDEEGDIIYKTGISSNNTNTNKKVNEAVNSPAGNRKVTEFLTKVDGKDAYVQNVTDKFVEQETGFEPIPEEDLKDINEIRAEAHSELINASEGSSAIERILTIFVVRGLGDAVRATVNAIFGNVSIDKLLYNEYPDTRLAFFSSMRQEGEETFLEKSGLLDSDGHEGILPKYFNLFKQIAAVFYIVILLYIGVRILLFSTGKQKEKYKSLLIDWVKGLLLIMFFPYAMKYIILMNDAIVGYLAEMKSDIFKDNSLPSLETTMPNEALDELGIKYDENSSNIMENMRGKALDSGRLTYGMLYLFLVKELIAFIFIYIKRLITVIFLICIFPLVMISYAIDKAGDGKAQVFSNWQKEYVLNVFLQAFQAINYLIVMSVVSVLVAADGTPNIIFMLIALNFVSKGDELLRSMFSPVSGAKGGTVSSLGDVAKNIAGIHIIKNLGRKVGNVLGRGKNVANHYRDFRRSVYNFKESRIESREERDKYLDAINATRTSASATSGSEGNIPATRTEYTAPSFLNKIQRDMQLALNGNPTEKIKAIERLRKYKNEENGQNMVNAEYSRLTDEQKAKIDNLYQEAAVMRVLSPDKREKMTERELNLNISLLHDIRNKNNGSNTIEKFLQTNYTKDKDGNTITLAQYADELEKGRILSNNEQVEFKKNLDLLGGVLGISFLGKFQALMEGDGNIVPPRDPSSGRDISRAICNRRAVSGNYRNLTNDEIDSLAPQAERLRGRYTSQGAIAASAVGATIMEYKRRVDSGEQTGIDSQESLRLFSNLNKIRKDNKDDPETKEVIRNVERGLGIKLDQGLAASSVAVIKEYGDLENVTDEVSERLKLAAKNIVNINKNSKNNVAKAIINRSEVDDIINKEKFSDKKKITRVSSGRATGAAGSTRVVNRTLEERMKEKIKSDVYNEFMQQYNLKDPPSQVRLGTEVLRETVKLGTSVGSLVATPALEVAAGITTAGLYAGASGGDKVTNVMAATDVGASTVDFIESFVPGTTSATKNKNSIGANVEKLTTKGLDKGSELLSGENEKERWDRRVTEKLESERNARKRINYWFDKMNRS